MGGAERFISEMSQYISKQSQTHHIIVIDNIVEYKIGSTAILHVLYNNVILKNIPKIRFFYCLYRLFKVVKKNKIQYLFCCLDSCAKSSVYLKRYLIPDLVIINICQNNIINKFSNNDRQKIIGYYKYAKKIIACSKGVAKSLSDSGVSKDKIKVITNCVNTSDKKNYHVKVQGNMLSKKDELKIITVGSLTPQKNHILFIKLIFELNKIGIDCSAGIIGEGEMRGDIESKISELNLSSKVTLFGWQNYVEYYNILSDHNIFVLTSNFEGLPLAILEAMSIGLPIISTDCESGPREILSGGKYGVLVPMKDSPALVKAIIKVKKSLKYYSDLSISHIDDYSTINVGNIFLNFINSLSLNVSK